MHVHHGTIRVGKGRGVSVVDISLRGNNRRSVLHRIDHGDDVKCAGPRFVKGMGVAIFVSRPVLLLSPLHFLKFAKDSTRGRAGISLL